VQKKKELEEITTEIERLKRVQRDQIFQTTREIGEYILLFFVIYLAKIFSLRLVRKFGNSFSKSHQEAILLFHRWIFNIVIIGVFFVIFASQFLSFLPFVAILGTAVGLALRDVIYSFI
jgi:small-conductance mechanosensitive channel